VTGVELIARLREAVDRTGELDWSLVRPDFEIHDHELLDSAVHRGRDGWLKWVGDWRQAVHRLRARGRDSGFQLERTDAQLWTFRGGQLARMDYHPDYRADEPPWSSPGS
jgi:ketosteroid isomerase-like protein